MSKLSQVTEEHVTENHDCPLPTKACGTMISRREASVRVGSWVIYLGALGGVSTLAANCGPTQPQSSGAENSPTPTGSETATPTGSATATPTGSASPTPTGTPDAACGCGTTPSGSAWHNTSLKASQVPLNAVAYNATNQIFICHDSQGFYCMDSLCPHQGCDMGTQGSNPSSGGFKANDLSAGFACNCHGSYFDGNGKVKSGSATTKNIPHYLLSTDSSGTFFVNWSQATAATCRC